jgi:hypothetical protein
MNLGLEAEFYVLKDSEAGAVPVSERDTLEKPCYDSYGALDNLHWLSELWTPWRRWAGTSGASIPSTTKTASASSRSTLIMRTR